MDSSRLRTGEIVAGIGGIAMFVFLFFDWFGGGAELSGSPGNLTISQPGISGWDALVDLPGFLIILSAVSGIALAYLAASGQRVNIPVQRGAVTAFLGSLAVLLILWRMFAGSPTLKIGAFLGLAAAVAIAAGALMALMEDGFRPLVAAPGGRKRAAAASAPPAAPPAPPTEEVPASTGAASGPATSGGSGSGGSSPAKRSATTKRSTTKKSSSPRSGGTRSRSRSSGSSATRSRSKSSGTKSTRAKSSGSKSNRSKSSASKSRSSKAGSSRKRSSGGRK